MKGRDIVKILKKRGLNTDKLIKGVYAIDTIQRPNFKQFAIVNRGLSSTSGSHWFVILELSDNSKERFEN